MFPDKFINHIPTKLIPIIDVRNKAIMLFLQNAIVKSKPINVIKDILAPTNAEIRIDSY